MKVVLLAVAVVTVLAGAASAHDRRLVPDGARLVEQWRVPAGGGVPEQLVVHWRQSMFHGLWFWERRSGGWARIGALPAMRHIEGMLVALGDLTGDGHPEIALQEGRGSGFCGPKLVVMTAPMRTMFRRGDCDLFLRIDDRALILSAGRYTLHDAHCCPTFTRHVRYVWTGRRMKPVRSELYWNCIDTWCRSWRSGPLRFRPRRAAYWNRLRGVAIGGGKPWLFGRTLDGGKRWFIADASPCGVGALRLGKPGHATIRLIRCRTVAGAFARLRTADYGRNWSPQTS